MNEVIFARIDIERAELLDPTVWLKSVADALRERAQRAESHPLGYDEGLLLSADAYAAAATEIENLRRDRALVRNGHDGLRSSLPPLLDDARCVVEQATQVVNRIDTLVRAS
jgi:hypothetical protein